MNVSNNVGGGTPPNGGPPETGNSLLGRTWKVIYYIPDAAAKTVMSTDGLYKLAKVVKAVCGATMVLFNDLNLAVIAPYNKLFGELDAIISPITIIERMNHFISGNFLKKNKDDSYKYSVWKNLNAGTLVIVKGTEGFMWMQKRGMDLGRLAQSVGGTPLYSLTRRVTAVSFKNAFAISASVFAIIDVAQSLVKHCQDPSFKTDPMRKQVLTLINESGKIVLTVIGAYYFTYTFAIISLMTAGTAMAKFLLNIYDKPNPGPEPAVEMAIVA